MLRRLESVRVQCGRQWRWFAIISAVLVTGALSSCAAKLIVQSEPPQADVFVKVEGRSDRIKIGQTPLEITERQLLEKLNLSADSTNWIQLTLEKQQFGSRDILLPSNRWGEREKYVKLALQPNIDKMTIVQQILAYFFNAKKYADIKQFDQAQAELDKVLQIDGKSVNAINMKAGIYFLQGNLGEAKRLYREALVIDPKFSDAIKMLERIESKEAVK